MDLAQFGASGAVVAVVVLFLKFIKEEAEKRDKTYANVAKALDKLSKATTKNTSATASADEYLRERNGRDNEHHASTLKAIQKIPTTLDTIAKAQEKAIIKAVKVDRQNVTEQKVEHQTVRHME